MFYIQKRKHKLWMKSPFPRTGKETQGISQSFPFPRNCNEYRQFKRADYIPMGEYLNKMVPLKF